MPVYKDEKRGTWYTSFWYQNWDGSRKRKKKEGFKTRREALEFERTFIAKQNGTTDMTVSAMVDIYLTDCATRLRPTTVESKRWMFESKILPHFGDVAVRDVTPAMIRQWQNVLLSDPAGYSQTYLKTINNQFSALMNYAIRYYGLHMNPVTRCGPFGKKKAGEMLFWTREEFGLFIDKVKKPASRLAFELLFWTGMREGELLALTLNDFDFSRSTVSITKNLAHVKGELVIQAPKTPRSVRTITVPRFVMAMVRDYADRLVDYDPSDRLFWFTKHHLYNVMAAASEEAGVKRIRIHDIRHSHASLLIEMNCSVLLISKRLGHESVQTTLETYAHLYPGKEGDLVDQIESAESENYTDEVSIFENNLKNLS